MTSGGASTQALLRLAPGAHLLLRSPHELQFGIDAANAGIVETLPGRARELRDAFATPTSHRELALRIKRVGMSTQAAFGLVDDLLIHGVLRREFPEPSLLILGSMQGVEQQLIRHAPGPCRHDRAPKVPLERVHADAVVVLNPHRLPTLIPTLAQLDTVFPVHAVDGRGVIGPLRVHGEGPCVMCADLHLSAADPLWGTIDADAKESTLEAPARLATAAAVLALVRALHHPHPSPGCCGLRATAGLRVTVDGMRSTVHTVEPHPMCPVCWGVRHGLPPINPLDFVPPRTAPPHRSVPA